MRTPLEISYRSKNDVIKIAKEKLFRNIQRSNAKTVNDITGFNLNDS